MHRYFLKRVNAQKLQSSVQCSRQVQFLVDDSHHQVNGHRDPDLSLHRVGARPVVMLDAQMAFDPAKKGFDYPPQAIELCHSERGNAEVVGEENQVAPSLLVVVTHLAQERGEVRPSFGQLWPADLVAANARGKIHGKRMLTGEAKVVLGSRHEEGSGSDNEIHAPEVQVSTIHHVEGPRFEKQVVEPSHVVLACLGDEDAGGNGTSQVDLRVDLDSRFGLSKIGPREQRQRQVDSRRVQSVNGIVDVEPEILPGVERPGFSHESLGQILPQPPIALIVGVGQSRLGHRLQKTQVVKSSGPRIQAVDDIPQTFPPGQLGKSHADELLSTTEMSDSRLRIVALHQTGKRLPMHEVENLRKDVAASVHDRKGSQNPRWSSNPSH